MSLLDMSFDQRDEVVVMTQILHVLYQFQSLYNGYFVVDASQNYCIWSDGMPALSGKPVNSVLGHRWEKRTSGLSAITEIGSGFQDELHEIIPSGTAQRPHPVRQSQLPVSDSQEITVDVHSMPLKRSDGRITGVVQLFRSKRGVERRTREYAELKLAATRDALTGAAIAAAGSPAART